MFRPLYRKYSDRFLSRWIVLIYDSIAVVVTYLIAHIIRYNFDDLTFTPFLMELQSIPVFFAYFSAFLITRSYSGIIRHTGLNDSKRVMKAVAFAFAFLLALSLVLRWGRIDFRLFPPLSVLVIHFLLVPFALIGSRLVIKMIYNDVLRKERKKHLRVVIYGAGSAGMVLRGAMMQDHFTQYEVIAFLDDNSSKVNKLLEGVPVMNPERVLRQNFIDSQQVQQMIIAIPSLPLQEKKRIVEWGLELGLSVKVVPAVAQWINGQLSLSQLREVKIEELLGREPIQIEDTHIHEDIAGKVVMVTGSAGSIGSEIVRQVLTHKPLRVILIDQAESALFELQNEIRSDKVLHESYKHCVFLIASVKDRFRMDRIFLTYRPNIIYHAAAYKHVPLMEENPYEALMVNVFGTKVMADLAVKYTCSKFVMISTDKAVNPTNIMGASKRIAEIYIQSRPFGKTSFITTRFGNVLGSNGSVIPLFKKQIEHGGPVTVTHREIIRYFMTIPEACSLVLEAGSIGTGSDIFVFDMGEPVRIYDMARKMIKLSGYEPDRDIQIVETGLRPGEKLFEELLSGGENTLHTHHPKVMRARVRKYGPREVDVYLDQLSELILEEDVFALVQKMKDIVPEFVSNNSVFQRLDRQ